MRRDWGALPKTACLGTWAEAVGQEGVVGDFQETDQRMLGDLIGEKSWGLHGVPQVCENVPREREGVHLQANPCEGDTGTEHITGPAPGGSPTHQ